MARLVDLVSKDGAIDDQLGAGANAWFAQVVAPVPTAPGQPLYVTIPELNFGGTLKWGPVNWGGRRIPALGSSLLVMLDNRQQLWAILAIADNDVIPPPAPVSSVFGRIGAVVKNAGDYAVADITGAESSSHAASTYETIAAAASTYETIAAAASTYETIAAAAATYATLTSVALLAPKANPVFTGDPQAPTPAPGDNDTSIATSAFVQAAITAQGLPKITTSSISGGPPASPNNMDIWIATGVGALGENWMFRFNSGSSSAFKWEFIGGSALQAGPLGSMTLSATGNTNLTSGPTITTPRTGDYIFEMGIHSSAGAAQFADVAVLNGSIFGNSTQIALNEPAAWDATSNVVSRLNGIASQTWNIQAAIANATVPTTISNGQLKVTPVRIS